MTKLFTHTEEIEHCGACADILDWLDTGLADKVWCGKTKRRRLIKNMWGEIPSWCPLPEKISDMEVIVTGHSCLRCGKKLNSKNHTHKCTGKIFSREAIALIKEKK